jgi:hypothetical protein
MLFERFLFIPSDAGKDPGFFTEHSQEVGIIELGRSVGGGVGPGENVPDLERRCIDLDALVHKKFRYGTYPS